MAYSASFEIDIISALSAQLLDKLTQLSPAPLDPEHLSEVLSEQGIYQLFHCEQLVYIGKADSLKKRLHEHRFKIAGRKNIDVEDMTFVCLYVHPNWTALAPEDALIKHYKRGSRTECAWNGNGFGPHDPGRDRETTNKPPDGFDAKYPIREDWICSRIAAGTYDAFELLKALKANLPYLLRFEMLQKKSRTPHPSLAGVVVNVPRDGMPAVELLALVAKKLPGWQATVFPSHMILYQENRQYGHGKRIWPK